MLTAIFLIWISIWELHFKKVFSTQTSGRLLYLWLCLINFDMRVFTYITPGSIKMYIPWMHIIMLHFWKVNLCNDGPVTVELVSSPSASSPSTTPTPKGVSASPAAGVKGLELEKNEKSLAQQPYLGGWLWQIRKLVAELDVTLRDFWLSASTTPIKLIKLWYGWFGIGGEWCEIRCCYPQMVMYGSVEIPPTLLKQGISINLEWTLAKFIHSLKANMAPENRPLEKKDSC